MSSKIKNNVEQKIKREGLHIVVLCPRFTRVCLLGYYCHSHPQSIKMYEMKHHNAVIIKSDQIPINVLENQIKKICEQCHNKTASRNKTR